MGWSTRPLAYMVGIRIKRCRPLRLGGDVRNPGRCGFRPGAEDWVAMMICRLGDTNVHIIINRVSASGTEWRLKELLRSSGFMARTGLLADNVHFLPRPQWRAWQGRGVQTPQPPPLSGRSRGLPYGHRRPVARVGNAFFLIQPCMPAAGSTTPTGHHHTTL